MSPSWSEMEGKVIWPVPFPFDKADFGECWRMGGNSPAAGEPDISCLIAVSGADFEPDPSTYKVVIEGIVGFMPSMGSPAEGMPSFGTVLAGVGSFAAGSEGSLAACLKRSTARAASSMPFFSGLASSFSSTTMISTSVPFKGSSPSSLSEAKGLSPASRAISECFPPAMKETSTASPWLGRYFVRLEPLRSGGPGLESGLTCGRGTAGGGLGDGCRLTFIGLRGGELCSPTSSGSRYSFDGAGS